MILGINIENLNNLIKSFYNLIGIKVAIYDTSFREVFSYPEENCMFCRVVQECAGHECDSCTGELCRKCSLTDSITLHKCHAGLTEVAAPLSNGSAVIGYIMFGQITNEKNRGEFLSDVEKRCIKYSVDRDELLKYAKEIPYFSDEHIHSVSDIINAIASYIILSQLVYEKEKPLIHKIKEFISSNLNKNLSVDSICRKFYISKSELYKLTKPYMPEGVAVYIKKTRIKKAAELLERCDNPLPKIAEETGFSDVNYFRRVFKKEMGISASEYRNSHRTTRTTNTKDGRYE